MGVLRVGLDGDGGPEGIHLCTRGGPVEWTTTRNSVSEGPVGRVEKPRGEGLSVIEGDGWTVSLRENEEHTGAIDVVEPRTHRNHRDRHSTCTGRRSGSDILSRIICRPRVRHSQPRMSCEV